MPITTLPRYLFQTAQYYIKRITDSILGDSIKIARLKEEFILKEFSQRAIQSQAGYAKTHLGLPFLKLVNFAVFTGEKYIYPAASYGDFHETSPETHDPQSRSPFAPLEEFIGMKHIINRNDKDVIESKREFKKYLKTNDIVSNSYIFFSEVANYLARDKVEQSINDLVCLACAKVLSNVWINVPKLPPEIAPLLEESEHCIFNKENIPKVQFSSTQRHAKALSDKLTVDNYSTILEHENYFHYLYRNFFPDDEFNLENFKKMNIFTTLIAQGNVSALITRSSLEMANLETVAEAPAWLSQLKKELDSIELTTENVLIKYEEIKSLPILDKFYREAVRCFYPAGPIVRKISKATVIVDVPIPARTYIFIPIRQILHDPALWKDPSEFNPLRKELDDYHLGRYPFIPFSLGPRMCPAASGAIEAMFKMAMVTFFHQRKLTLTHSSLSDSKSVEIEKIAATAKQPRVTARYFGTLQQIDIKEENVPPLTCYTAHKVKKNQRDKAIKVLTPKNRAQEKSTARELRLSSHPPKETSKRRVAIRKSHSRP